jgi:hypothetical protein
MSTTFSPVVIVYTDDANVRAQGCTLLAVGTWSYGEQVAGMWSPEAVEKSARRRPLGLWPLTKKEKAGTAGPFLEMPTVLLPAACYFTNSISR